MAFVEKPVYIPHVIRLIENGYSRWKKDATGRPGSVQEFYDLTFAEATELFAREELKNVKLRTSRMIILNEEPPADFVPVRRSRVEEDVEEPQPLEELLTPTTEEPAIIGHQIASAEEPLLQDDILFEE